jgi:predicted N-acetyltransferase YhbS
MGITYQKNVIPAVEQIIELYNSAGLPRPTNDPDRMKKIFENSGLVITAWDDDKLVGICRTITDWVWCSYLADLAVYPIYRGAGIGKKLIELTKETLGEQSMVLLISVPEALDYYPKLGFSREEKAFINYRTQ